MARRVRNANSTTARWLAGALVAVLAIGTVVLAALAIERTRQTPDADGPGSSAAYTASPASGEPSPQPPTSPSPVGSPPTLQPAPTVPAEERFLAVGQQALWRATAGDCGATPPVLEHSTDAGETWTDVTPTYRQIGQVLSLDAFAGIQAESIALMGAGCEVQALRTFTQGEFWAPYADVLAASRYLDPADPSTVVTPAGRVPAPCEAPTSFRAGGDVVALVCDGIVSRLDGSEWRALPIGGVAAIAIVDDAVLTASAADGCSGAAVTRWSGADASEPLGCAAEVDLSSPLAIAASGDTVLLWSGDQLFTVAG